MFTRQINARVSLHLSGRLEMLFGLLAIQNPKIFYPDSELLRPFQKLKDRDGSLLSSLIPEEDLETSEGLIPRLIAEDTVDVSSTVPLTEPGSCSDTFKWLWQTAWDLGGSQQWKSCEERYLAWWQNTQPTNAQQVVALAEVAQGMRLADEHRRLLERARHIVIIPTFLSYPQLGFNPLDDTLFLIIGLPGVDAVSSRGQQTVKTPPISVAVNSFAALGDERRMAIMQLLLETPSLTGVEMAERLCITPATVSHHLSILAQHSLINRERRRREVLYTPDRSRLAALGRLLINMEKEED